MLKARAFIGLAMGALLLLGLAGAAQISSAGPAAAANCASDCRAGYSSCLIRTRNRAACNAALQSCLTGCISGRRRLGGPMDWFFDVSKKPKPGPAYPKR